MDNADDAEVVLYNSLGKVVFRKQYNSAITVSEQDLSAGGIYFYEVVNQGVTTSGKVVVVR